MVSSAFYQKSLKFCLLVASFGILNTSTSQATPLVGPGCDPAFMRAIQDKAWMEAQREIMIAQTTIAKPDSVFSLGCFGSMNTGFNIAFGNGNNYPYIARISSYLGAAFPHNHGGGHFPAGTSNSNISTCSAMMSLWNAARGANLDQPSRLLDTVRNIATYNRGAFPTVTAAPSGAFAAPIARIYNPTAPGANTYNAKTAGQSVGAGFDDMNLFIGSTAPFSQTAVAATPTTPATPARCAPGIPTGIIMATGGCRPEIVCPNPGCISDGTATPRCQDYTGSAASQSAVYTPSPAPTCP